MNFQTFLVLLLFVVAVAIVIRGAYFIKTCIHNIRTMDDPLFCKIDDLKFPSANRNYEIVICAIKRVYKENGLLDQQLKTMNNSEALDYLWSRKVYLDDITGLIDRANIDLKSIASGILVSLIVMVFDTKKINIVAVVFAVIFFVEFVFALILFRYYYRGKNKVYGEATEEYEKKLLNKKMDVLIDRIEMEDSLFNVYALRQWVCNSCYKKRFKSRLKRKELKELQKMSFFEKDVRDLEFTVCKSKDAEVVLPSKLDDKRNEVELPDRIQRLLELAQNELKK